MQWNQKDGYWCMPLDPAEREFAWVGDLGKPIGCELWVVMVSARVQFASADPARDVRNAWRAQRFIHPGIAVQLIDTEKRYETVRDEPALEAWCDATFHVESDALSSDDLFKNHIRVAGPQVTCHWIPAANQIALVTSHWRLDAYVFSIPWGDPSLDPPTFTGEEVKNLAVSFDEALALPDRWDPSWEQRALDLQAKEVEGGPGIGLQPSYPNVLPGGTDRIEIVLSEEETTALRTAARQHGFTITSVLHASMIVETLIRNPDSPATRFMSIGLFDMRKYCKPPRNGPGDAGTLRMHFQAINVDARASWDELAHTLQELYHQSWDWRNDDAIFLRRPFIDASHAVRVKTPPDAPQPAEPVLNSLGIIDSNLIQHQYGAVKVEHVSYNNSVLTKQTPTEVFTWDGRMHISANFNEAFYTSEFVENFLLSVKENALENLGISAGMETLDNGI
ncbi:uncharacterized protein N7483_004152 [Penicillium malachiteum]|uniref:uncharacterized protein n=1 Tax=Penicillium malachiteum TaxID=1324776 RepID=UPI002547E2E5|nr:uncharacterized protein N7483_004152 [Penicillium malachiteum]KAJ5729644.1 hypothetical protein N7483_004152 [Penicillium malachiteum]